jgi:very-long-chain (3R)-3-hydroxyacyl-CoA dehydratase
LSDLYCLRMPNKLNFGFDYYYMSIVALLAYIPGISSLFFAVRPMHIPSI